MDVIISHPSANRTIAGAIDRRSTPADLIADLIDSSFLKPVGAGQYYSVMVLQDEERYSTLMPNIPIATQGVASGADLKVSLVHRGY